MKMELNVSNLAQHNVKISNVKSKSDPLILKNKCSEVMNLQAEEEELPLVVVEQKNPAQCDESYF